MQSGNTTTVNIATNNGALNNAADQTATEHAAAVIKAANDYSEAVIKQTNDASAAATLAAEVTAKGAQDVANGVITPEQASVTLATTTAATAVLAAENVQRVDEARAVLTTAGSTPPVLTPPVPPVTSVSVSSSAAVPSFSFSVGLQSGGGGPRF
jgi:ABC-type Na+ efflux pump permease subunit